MTIDYFSDVSRETKERLRIYEALIQKWNPTINLVSPSTLHMIQNRHFADSAQLIDYAPREVNKWCDLGTGGGFPGLVMAIMAQDFDPNRHTVCIESDLRKATFLRTVIRETDLRATVISERIESAPAQSANLVSSRALAPLNKLLGYAKRHLGPKGECLFLKGENYLEELEEALESWRFEYDTYPSKTNPHAMILRIGDLNRA